MMRCGPRYFLLANWVVKYGEMKATHVPRGYPFDGLKRADLSNTKMYRTIVITLSKIP